MPSTPTISAVYIVKDEEDVLDASLAAVSWVDEIIVYDTGSTDATREIAARHTPHVIEGYWDDDFGAARNRALAHATSEWILVVDADEVFRGSTTVLRQSIASGKTDLYLIAVTDAETSTQTEAQIVGLRVFRRADYHYAGRLHEQVVAKRPLSTLPVMQHLPDARLVHSGYSQTALETHGKNERNVTLARKDVADAQARGADPFEVDVSRANLARSLIAAEDYRGGLDLAREVADAGRLPGPTLEVLARAAVGATIVTGARDEREEWLARWESIAGASPWALAMRVRIAAGENDLDAVLDLLDRLPTTAVDSSSGRRFMKHELAEIEVGVLTNSGKLSAAARTAIEAARSGYASVGPTDLVRIFARTRRPLRTMIEALHERVWREYAVRCAQEATPAALEFLREMATVRPADPAVLLCASGAARTLDLEQLAWWAAEIRRGGLARYCPLVEVSQWSEGDVRTRVLAAAMAVGIYGDERAVDGLGEALEAVAPAEESEMLAQIEILAPGLVHASG